MMVKFEEFQKGVGVEEKLRLVRSYYPHEFAAKDGYSLTVKGLAALKKKHKNKIDKFYNSVRPFVGTATHRVHVKSEEKASAAWRSLFGVEPPRGVRYVPVVGNTPKLEFYEAGPDDLRARVRDENIEVSRYFFADYGISKQDLLNDAAGALTRMHETIGGARYSILTGDHLYTQGGGVYVDTIQNIIKQIERWRGAYGAEKKKGFFGEVLIGLQAYNFDSIDDFADYRDEQYERRKERKDIGERLTRLNKAIKDSTESIENKKRERQELAFDLALLMQGVKGKEKAKMETLLSVRNLKSKIRRADSALKGTPKRKGMIKTLATYVKEQKQLIKQLSKKRE